MDRVAQLRGLQRAMKLRRGLVRPARLDGGTPVGGREKRQGRAADRHRQWYGPVSPERKASACDWFLASSVSDNFPGQDLAARPHGRGDVGGEGMLAAVAGQRDGAIESPGQGVGEAPPSSPPASA